MKKSEILKKIKSKLQKNQSVYSFEYKQTSVDELGIPQFEISYKNPPKNFRLVRLIEPLQIAILEDFDYKEETKEDVAN